MSEIQQRIAASLLLALLARAQGADWPQWQGPARDNVSRETGLLKKWPAGGPKRLWIFQGLGKGYSSPITVGDRIYVTGSAGKDEILFALDAKGKKLWQTTYGPLWTRSFAGARTCPTYRDGRLFVSSSDGTVACVNAQDGQLVWAVDMKKRFGARDIRWGLAESPLVGDGKVICTPGGSKAALAALDVKDGRTLWTAPGMPDSSAYCSPLAVRRGTRTVIVTAMSDHIVGVDAKDGKLLWSHGYKTTWAAHANTPVYGDGTVYVTSGYDDGGVALRLSTNGDSVRELWRDKTLDNHHGGLVLLDGLLYGANWLSNAKGKWVCLDFQTGKPRYEKEWNSKGSITSAEGMLYCYEEKRGTVALVKATPAGFNPISTFKITEGDGQHWAHPVVSGGRLFIRHGDVLMAYDIKGN